MTSQLNFQDFAPTQRIRAAVVSPCGQFVAYTNGADKNFNLFIADRDSGEHQQVTDFADRSVRAMSWMPDSSALILAADKDGDEYYQLFSVSAEGGDIKQLTDRPTIPHEIGGGSVSPCGRFVVFSANITNELYSQLWLHELATGEETEITTEPCFMVGASWTPDGAYLVGAAVSSNTDQRPFKLAVESKELEWLAPGGDLCSPLGELADGRVLAVSGAGREFTGLAFIHNGSVRDWMFAPEWDVELAVVSADQSTLAAVVNEDGYSRLVLLDPETGKELESPVLPTGVVQACSVSRDGSVLCVLHSGPQSPTNVLVLERGVEGSVSVTGNAPRAVEVSELVNSELIETRAHDGLRLPAFVYRPSGPGPFPVVFSIHGGPQAQEVADYRPLYQALVSQGVAVVAPNIRGSSGYGVSQVRMIEANWGADDLRDVATLREFVAGLEWADESRFGVFGGSYGGFMVLSCMSRQPELWAVGVDIVGPSDLISMFDNVPPTWKPMMKSWLGDPETEGDRLRAVSPATYADQVRSPLFVIQGAKDPRVVKEHSDVMVERIRAAGAEVRYDVYPDEGHGFTRKVNEDKAMQDSLEFLVEHLMAD